MVESTLDHPNQALDLDPFETAILNDLLVEWSSGGMCIPSIPTELMGQVRFDLIRLEAWMQLEHEPLLFLFLQNLDYQPYQNIKAYCATYARFKDVVLLCIDDAEFIQKFTAAAHAGQRVVVCLPTEAFPPTTPQQFQSGICPETPPWSHYTFIVGHLPEGAYWPVFNFLGAGESVFLRCPLTYISIALMVDRCR